MFAMRLDGDMALMRAAVMVSVGWHVVLSAHAVDAAEPPPNVVLIISDDQTWTDYGFMGHEEIQTPHLDVLARQSALFTRGYVPTALCRPSLMTLVTGLYAHQHRTTGNDPSPAVTDPKTPAYDRQREKLIAHVDELDTLPTWLSKKSYRSHQSGKWWEGSYRRGGFSHGMTRGFPEPGGRHGDDGLKIGRQGLQPIFDFVDQAVEDETPFFVWYAPFLPHLPHTPPERLLKKYQRDGRHAALAKYYAMCEWFDETCGQLVNFIDGRALAQNTLIIYVTDNGWIQRTPETQVPAGWRTQFAPKSKQSPNEGGTRTPIMLRWSGVIEPSQRSELVSSIDLVPTILQAAGVAVPEHLPGSDLLSLVRDGKPLQRERIFGESFAHDIVDTENPEATLLYRWCIEGRWKLLLTYDGVVNRYRAVHLRTDPGPQLYDLWADPHETTNLAGDHPGQVGRLAQRIEAWWPVHQRQTKID